MGKTTELLESIEDLAALMFSVDEVAMIVGVDAGGFQADDEMMTTYRRGQLKAMADVRKSILKMAKNGSTPAQKQLVDMMRDVERKNRSIKRCRP